MLPCQVGRQRPQTAPHATDRRLSFVEQNTNSFIAIATTIFTLRFFQSFHNT
jgi:hypothetical protein